jgi:hypothetical protein
MDQREVHRLVWSPTAQERHDRHRVALASVDDRIGGFVSVRLANLYAPTS